MMRESRGGDRGSVLIVVVVATAALAMLGIGVLSIGALETSASRSGLDARRAALAAEAGLALVKKWFDAPVGSAGAWLVPLPSEVDRSLRRVDPDGDGTFESYAAVPSPWNVVYRQGADDLFDRPYRGGPSLAFEADARGPDILISDDSGSAPVRDFISRVSLELFGSGSHTALRLRRIAVYAPPTTRNGALRIRYGIASIDVTAIVVRRMAHGDETVASARATGVLQAVPYGAPGPLTARASIAGHGGLDLRWGSVAAALGIDLGADPSAATVGGWPWVGPGRRLTADSDVDGSPDDGDLDGALDLDEWLSLPDASLSDPWYSLTAGGALAGSAPGPQQPFPFDAGAIPGVYATDDDRSGLFQRVAGAASYAPDAALFREAAARGGPSGHLFRYVAGTSPPLFREGSENPVDFESATGGRDGLFYFDTTDGLPPRDADGDGSSDNLTPPIVVSSPDWHASGCLFLNAESFSIMASARAGSAEIAPPGEPFDDVDRDGTCGPQEPFLGLDYPPDPLAGGAAFVRRGVYPCGGAVARRSDGPATSTSVSFSGVLLTTGRYEPAAGARIFGAVAAAGDVGVDPLVGPLDPPFQILYDARLATDGWPGASSPLPRTAWQRRTVSH